MHCVKDTIARVNWVFTVDGCQCHEFVKFVSIWHTQALYQYLLFLHSESIHSSHSVSECLHLVEPFQMVDVDSFSVFSHATGCDIHTIHILNV